MDNLICVKGQSKDSLAVSGWNTENKAMDLDSILVVIDPTGSKAL